MGRRYKVEGTKDFLYWSIGLLLLGLWAVKDGWFPSQRTLRLHPREMALGFEQPGVLAEYRVAVGDEFRTGHVLAIQQRTELENRRTALERQLGAVADEAAVAGPAVRERRAEEISRWEAELVEVRRQLAARELKAPTNGYVRALLRPVDAPVRAGETVIEIRVRDHFYPFNQTLAFLSLLGSLVCIIIHLKVR